MRHLFVLLLCLSLLSGAAFCAEQEADGSDGLTALVQLLGQIDDPAVQLDLLKGMSEALKGRRNVKMPAGWAEAYATLSKSSDAEVRQLSQLLGLCFADPKAISELCAVVEGRQLPAQDRRAALQALVDQGVTDMAPLLFGLLDDSDLRGSAIRALAACEHKETPKRILARYASLSQEEKTEAVQTLASRAAYARQLLDAVEEGRVKSADIPVFTARQLSKFDDPQITARLAKVWGTVHESSQEKTQLKAKYQALLTADYLAGAVPSAGRAVYDQTCAQCHTLFGNGGKLGPDLTGSQRASLDYVLENALDPNAIISKEFQMTVVATVDGRLISGIVGEENDETLILQTPTGNVIVPKDEIEEMKLSTTSMMPEGLLEKLASEQLRDLVAYLAGGGQVEPTGGSGQ